MSSGSHSPTSHTTPDEPLEPTNGAVEEPTATEPAPIEISPQQAEEEVHGVAAEADGTKISAEVPAEEFTDVSMEDNQSALSQRPEEVKSDPVAAPTSVEDLTPSTPSQTTPAVAPPSVEQDPAPSTPSRTTAPTASDTTSGRSSAVASTVLLLVSSLESISNAKEGRNNNALKESVSNALLQLRNVPSPDNIKPHTIFEPLKLACETKSIPLMITSLDCIGKVVTYAFFADPTPPHKFLNLTKDDPEGAQSSGGLTDEVVATVCDCFIETAPDAVQLQIVKAILAIVLSPKLHVHQSSLLKAVRTVYNIFLLSKSPMIQTVAQGSLTQIVDHVFARVTTVGEHILQPNDGNLPFSAEPSSASLNGFDTAKGVQAHSNASTDAIPGGSTSRISNGSAFEGKSTEQLAEESDGVRAGIDPSTSTDGEEQLNTKPMEPENVPSSVPNEPQSSSAGSSQQDENQADTLPNGAPAGEQEEPPFFTVRDYYVKDAFLVFRALCKLSMKPLGSESEKDLRSHAMRSKLLALQLILNILKTTMPLFVDPSAIIHSASTREQTPFIQAVKQYLCLSLSRNGVSPVIAVFELSCEMFWLTISGLRTKLKKEIEVLLNEIFLPILEMKNSSVRQKSILLRTMSRLCHDPQTLVDIYLNYDCDRSSLDNIYERLINIISKVGTQYYQAHSQNQKVSEDAASDAHLKKECLDCLVAVLRSLVAWAGKGVTLSLPEPSSRPPPSHRPSVSEEVHGSDTELAASSSSNSMSYEPTDDPGRFGNAKQRKTTLLEGIKKFNFKPKRGIDFLIQNGFIRSAEPAAIAHFLLHADGLNKAVIGEYLGEGETENIAIMHAFVDMMDFTTMQFVDAVRLFLQSFRLPGEAQKIDRFMLKFAERYLTGNPTSFANADTAYVLAFSVIMLNTDAHNPVVKHRMTKQDFIKNNRGINDGQDLPEELLGSIFDEICEHEIKMKDEEEAVVTAQPISGLAGALATVGRDLQREAYVLLSEGMATKTEALFRTMLRSQKRSATSQSTDQFYIASHFEHVKPMFQVVWTPLLAGISAPLQYSSDIELVGLSLDGFKQAIKIVCLFDLELERNAFVTTLAKFTFLNNLGEMKPKNVEAIKALLDVAMVDGNYLKSSWREVIVCVSHLERFQLISQGVDARVVPELGRNPPPEEVARETQSAHITIAADMIFSSSKNLSGVAIVDFVQALSDVSWKEIQSSGLSEHPRVFCLQKLVEISYYNMARIRMEWSNIWVVLGEHFNQVCCHTSQSVSFFALDSLRQLAMRFLEKEELPHFKFQKDFLAPFEYAMVNNHNTDARDMVLQCLQQMIAARAHNMRSGWRTMFGVFSAASKVSIERIAAGAFEIVLRIKTDHFLAIVTHASFADLTVCLTDFCKISKFQKISLHAIEVLKSLIPQMLSTPECRLDSSQKAEDEGTLDSAAKFWFPVLFGFYDVIMNGEDLEVRKRALDYLFEVLKQHGKGFPRNLWNSVCKEVLFPIFAVLRSRSDVTRFSTHEDMSVWLSTTMIQALRNLVDLFSFYFDALGHLLDELLELLCECILQENDTLARIGTSCLQQLLEQNVQKLKAGSWEKIVSTFIHLFRTTTAYQLFDDTLRLPPSPTSESPSPPGQAGFIFPLPLSPAPANGANNPPSGQNGQARHDNPATDRRRAFRQIIVKCVLQLLLIETSHELLRNNDVYSTIPAAELLKLMAALEDSYRFAKRFNADKELRMALWKVGFMKQLPNLLKQESSSAATLVAVLVRMYSDERADHVAKRRETVHAFVPLGLDILSSYASLDPETQSRNIAAWTPVVANVLHGFSALEADTFATHVSSLYPITTDILSKDIAPEVREGLREVFISTSSYMAFVTVS
ncbi:Sec7-domain-containing protein [Atractiella rhizophila]|nr:Sec7-domain-containing protein [Atractiella rhizophila]